MNYLVVGLGNPGEKYAETRHNVGFKVVEKLANEKETPFITQKLADIAKIKFKGRNICLVKPNTYMNLSGKAVNYWLQQEKVPLENLIVITDDLALPFGKLRMKGQGSSGGHNGLKDIEETLKTTAYTRLRFGVGADFSKGKQVDYVLGEWSEEEKKSLNERIEIACEFIKSYVSVGLNMTMSNWNNK
jgi:peptidyl-tRNA hydrolase, PTH1 family